MHHVRIFVGSNILVVWAAPSSGRALFLSKSSACATADQWTDQGMGGARPTGVGCDGSDNELQLRSENQIQQVRSPAGH